MKFGIFYEHQLSRPWEEGDELLEQVATESALGGGGLRDKMPRERAPKD